MPPTATPAIDSHAHLLHRPGDLDKLAASGEFEQVWLMDLSGYGELGGCRFADEKETLDIVRRFDGFFLAFGYLDLDRDAPDRVDQLRDLGYVGLKPYKQRRPYGDERYFPLYERAQALGMPLLCHTGLVAPGDAQGAGRAHGHGPDNLRPIHLAGVAEAFPDLRIVGGHQGYPFLEETWHNLYYYRHLYMDVSGYMRSIHELDNALDRRVHDGTERYFNDKILFATDTFYGRPETNARALDLLRFWRLYFEFVGGLYYRWGREDERDKFFRDNARALRDDFLRAQGR